MGIQLGSLKPRQRVARGSKVKDRCRTRRGSQSSPKALRLEFDSLRAWSLKAFKPREFESLRDVGFEYLTFESLRVWEFEDCKLEEFED